MYGLFRHRPSPALAVSLVAMIVALGGVAWASIPDASGVIHGCYNKSGGALRVIDTAISTQKCTSLQLPLNWNQTGPPGPTGPQGAAGPAGPQGPAGATNVAEYDGVGADTVVLGPLQSQASIKVMCLPGQVATGGGGVGTDQAGAIDYGVTFPRSEAVLSSSGVPIGWQVAAKNGATEGDAIVSARVICASP
jgi:hypothetical protein